MKDLRPLFEVLSDILSSLSRNKMFSIVSRTWNPVSGCTHMCVYCWARRLAETKLRNTRRYRNGFKPRLNPEEFRKRFKPGDFVFCVDMGDLFCEAVPDSWIRKIIEHVSRFPKTYFLFLTKNPARYRDFLSEFPPNVILGATIETNRDDLYVEHKISQAPPPSERYRAMRDLDWPKKFISIEPILDFELEVFAQWITEIKPMIVYVGYDNYNNKLPEPPLDKTLQLIDKLLNYTLVIKKTIRKAHFEAPAC